MVKTVLITGANRGIGLELAKQYIQNGDEVIACCRQPTQASALKEIIQQGNGTVFQLDVTNEDSIQQLAQTLAGKAIDILINNAGVYGESQEKISQISPENMRYVFETNVIGATNVSQILLDNVRKSKEKTLVVVSSVMGSIGENTGGSYTYRASKAAINAVMQSFAHDLEAEGIHVIVLHPGWVRTDMGGPNATTGIEESATGIRNVIANKQIVTKRGFVDFRSEHISW